MDIVKQSGIYDLETYMKPYWDSEVIYNETIYPLEEEDGSLPVIPLMYRADEIIAVRTTDLETLYVEGKDYVLEDGGIRVIKGGSIPTMPYNEFFFEEDRPGKCMTLIKGGHVFFSEGDVFHRQQVCVTYRHSDKWEGPIPPHKGHLLPLLKKRLAAGEPLKVVAYGDSITCGANSSGAIGAKPFVPKWPDMFPQELERVFGSKVEVIDTAEGGQYTPWGREHVVERVAVHKPDLVLLAFGMNDGTHGIQPQEYKENFCAMIDAIRAERPDCSIMVLNSIMPNSTITYFPGLQDQYRPVLEEIEAKYDELSYTDIVDLHKYLLTRKRYHDMTGNNVNHLNDFTARLYAQALFATIQD